MPTVEKKQTSELVSVIDSLLDEKHSSQSEGSTDFISIIDFIERFKLLPNGLFPVQKFILKLYYNIPLDDKEKVIQITDRFNREVLHDLTEVEYLKYLHDQKRCNIKEQDGITRHELILVLGRRAGKCIDGDSLVLTDGGVLPIKELGDSDGPKWQDLKVGVAQEGSRKSRSAKFYNGGVQPTKRIKTDAGFEECGTLEHRVKILDESGNIVWRELGRIKIGDYVGLHRNTDLWAKEYLDVCPYHIPSPGRELTLPNFLDERWGKLLGILTGDGSWTYENCVAVTGGCEEFREIVESLCVELFGHSSITRKRSRPSTCPRFPWLIRVFSKPTRKFLHELGWNTDAKSVDKRIPWSILRSPKSVVAAYLSGLFETDGGLEKNGTTISFYSASNHFARQVQILLLNFGIVSRVSPKFNKKYARNYYRVVILGYESRVKFAEQIGFLTDRKNSILVRGIERGSGGHSDTESVPHQKDRLRRLIDSVPISHNNAAGTSARCRTWLREICGNSAKIGSDENLSYARLRRVVELGKKFGADPSVLAEFDRVIEADYFWDPVVSISDERCPVFDLNVPDGESFVANGMTNHNSTLSSIIASYELYKLLCRRNPQSYYGIPANSEIRVLCVANDKEQASIVYGDMSGYIDNVDYFKSAITNQTQTFMKFQTDQDRQKYGKGNRATITATFKSSIAKGLRGRGIICYILDEIAFFVNDGKCLSTDTYILTTSGYVTLDEILTANNVDRSTPGWTPIDLDIVQEGGKITKATRIYYGGQKKVKRLFSHAGQEILATSAHKFRGITGWKKVGHLKERESVKTGFGVRYWPEEKVDCSKFVKEILFNGSRSEPFVLPKVVDERLAEYMALYIADYKWIHRYVHAPWYSPPEKQVQFLGLLGCRRQLVGKRVPWTIFKSPKSVVSTFIKNIFDVDGSIHYDSIRIKSSSIDFLKDLQILLTNFGILSEVIIFRGSASYEYLDISDRDSKKLFRDEIGSNFESTLKKIDKACEKRSKTRIKMTNVAGIGTAYKRALQMANGRGYGVKIPKVMTTIYDADVKRLDLFCKKNDLKSQDLACLKAYVRNKKKWCHIYTLPDQRTVEVADLYVPDGHNYIANGFISHNSSAEQVYRAVHPSIAQFSPKDPKNKHRPLGPSDGRSIMISSPDAKDGFFYKQYQTSLCGGAAAQNTLMIQAPTWEVNPTLDSSYYEVEFNKDPKSFDTEHGAEFSDRVRGWIEEKSDLIECVNYDLRPLLRGRPRELYWAGVDFGIVRDGTAIAIVHFVNGKIELAYHEVWYAGKSWAESNPHLKTPVVPSAHRLRALTRLDMADIAEWFKTLSTMFFIEKAVFDQWAGPIFEQELHKRGLKQFETRNFSPADSSQAYHNMKMSMLGHQLSLYDYPIPESISDTVSLRHSPLIEELLELQATSGGKNITIVEAPGIAGKHDDMSDALARAVLLATEHAKAHPGVLESSMVVSAQLPQAAPFISYRQYHAQRQRIHGRSDRSPFPLRRMR